MESNENTKIISSMSISIACYNDEATIGALIGECFDFLDRRAEDCEVFVVNDGSADGSAAILDGIKEKNPRLRVHHHERNRSFGPTFARIYQNTSKEVNGMLPGDAQISPEALGVMLPHLADADLVLGYRKDRADPWRRRIASGIYNFLIRLVSGQPIRDVNTVCVYKTSVMEGVELRARSAFIHAEFFLKLVRKGCRYKSVTIPHKRREAGAASGGRLGVMIAAAKEFLLYLFGKI